ncbi:eukaryotic aspartyl protease domain-containing protein [Ditylenchus destructor]|nr:eukaryotic aspartyl protease domain-containing protein [Ditylenchus destructor]
MINRSNRKQVNANKAVLIREAISKFQIGGISFQNVTFGLVTEYKVPVENAPLGGYLSFYPDISSDGLLPSIWYSIIKELDLPILTLWSNRSMECTTENLSGCEGVSSRITLGALDIEMCPGVWAYADQIQNLTSLTGFEFHVDSATFLLGDEANVDQILSLEECENLNETAVIFPGYFPMRVPGALLDLIQAATNASYDRDEKIDFVDCGLRDAHGLVTLRVGQLAHPLHLTGRDLIEYDNTTGKCYLEVERSSRNTFEDISNTHPSIVLSQRFLNNHCLAYNFDLKQFAFSSMPPDESDREYGIRAFDYP